MSYNYEKHTNTVTLTMTREDYERILMAIGMAAGYASRDGSPMKAWLGVADRINQGNPNWMMYTEVK